MSFFAHNVIDEEQLPFYKAPHPRANAYRFEQNDFETIPVVQRFKRRPIVVPSSADPNVSSNNSQVTEGGRAYQAGVQLGDSIVKINDEDTADMSLDEAHKRIQAAGDDLKLSVKKWVRMIVLKCCELACFSQTPKTIVVGKRTI